MKRLNFRGETHELKPIGADAQASGHEPVVSGQLTDERLRNFGEVWKMDGDLMRCTGCSRAIISSRKNETPAHAHSCPKAGYMDNQNPWALLTNWLLAH